MKIKQNSTILDTKAFRTFRLPDGYVSKTVHVHIDSQTQKMHISWCEREPTRWEKIMRANWLEFGNITLHLSRPFLRPAQFSVFNMGLPVMAYYCVCLGMLSGPPHWLRIAIALPYVFLYRSRAKHASAEAWRKRILSAKTD
jgi:hypothetical protein